MTETMTVSEYLNQTSGKKVKHGSPEHDEQVKLFQWAELRGNQDERLKLLFAIPNGAFYGKMWTVAKKMKAEGLKSGVPDIMLPVACGRFHGLFIEMKSGKNKPSENQEWWFDVLRIAGYFVNVCYSCEEAIDTIELYLNSGKFRDDKRK